MRTDELDFDLPEELIAQTPALERDGSRLLVLQRASGRIEHRTFSDLAGLLDPADLVVLNTSRVLHARVHARKPSGGRVELLLLEQREDSSWEALARPSRRIAPGLVVTAGALAVAFERSLGDGRWIVRPSASGDELHALLAEVGELPLPPYVHSREAPADRYQTVYADRPGSAAAPTAGLHFTPELLDRIRERCEICEVELRVGLGTFRPVVADDLAEHEMHSEAYRVAPAARTAIAAAVASRRRIVCIGTTSLRVVETVADPSRPSEGRTAILIAPGYAFRANIALVTNFHLPRSTLLALVMAVCGVDETRRLYREAIAERYRFFSFGDACLIE